MSNQNYKYTAKYFNKQSIEKYKKDQKDFLAHLYKQIDEASLNGEFSILLRDKDVVSVVSLREYLSSLGFHVAMGRICGKVCIRIDWLQSKHIELPAD